MKIPDVNVLVSAFRVDSPHHDLCRSWLEDVLQRGEPVGLSELVLSGTVRILTHPRVWAVPERPESAIAFTQALVAQPRAVRLRPGEAHWAIFRGLCEAAHVTGNRVADAYHAALAIEHGGEWITLDRDFAAFAGLRFRHLLGRISERPAAYRAASRRRRSARA